VKTSFPELHGSLNFQIRGLRPLKSTRRKSAGRERPGVKQGGVPKPTWIAAHAAIGGLLSELRPQRVARRKPRHLDADLEKEKVSSALHLDPPSGQPRFEIPEGSKSGRVAPTL
jgi:hypothetical protein